MLDAQAYTWFAKVVAFGEFLVGLGVLVGALVLDVAYWSIWFISRDTLASEHREAYYEFENAFPLADFWLGVACLLALVSLVQPRPSAYFWLACAGAAALYLFGMDFLYDVEHGIFAKGAGGVIEACIVAVTLHAPARR